MCTSINASELSKDIEEGEGRRGGGRRGGGGKCRCRDKSKCK